MTADELGQLAMPEAAPLPAKSRRRRKTGQPTASDKPLPVLTHVAQTAAPIPDGKETPTMPKTKTARKRNADPETAAARKAVRYFLVDAQAWLLRGNVERATAFFQIAASHAAKIK